MPSRASRYVGSFMRSRPPDSIAPLTPVDEADDRAHQRALAVAVQADQADALPLGDLEVDGVEHLQRAVAGRQAAHRQRGGHVASPASSKYALRTIGSSKTSPAGPAAITLPASSTTTRFAIANSSSSRCSTTMTAQPQLLDDAPDDGVDLVDLVGQQTRAGLVHQQDAERALQQAGQKQLAALQRVEPARQRAVGRRETDQFACVSHRVGRHAGVVGVSRRAQRVADAQRGRNERRLEGASRARAAHACASPAR